MKTVIEWCAYCEEEVEISTLPVEGVCPNCGKGIIPCNMCDHNIVDCSKCHITERVLFLPEIVNITKSIDVNDLPKDSDSLYQYAMNIYKALDTIYGNRTQEQFLNDIKNHG